jgi:hypothetical protein
MTLPTRALHALATATYALVFALAYCGWRGLPTWLSWLGDQRGVRAVMLLVGVAVGGLLGVVAFWWPVGVR